ncbi:MAG: esterase family protein [Clostridia bacterium]|nr:esterase family protein [Clostridia bacterium]
MALMHAHFFSRALNVASSVEVILPESDQGIGVTASGSVELPKVLYLLHGYSDDQTIWQRRTSIERYAASHNLAIIMPAVNHSFYCNETHGERYWDYVAEELPAQMQRFFRISDKPEDTFVAGLSMGGYGAMKLALTYPERFAAAASFSGAADIASMSRRRLADWGRIFGRQAVRGTEHDLFHLMKQNADAPRKPRLYVSCGTADFLYDQHLKFVPALRRSGWDVTSYEEPDAVHEWGFWDREVAKFIPWMLEE